jgi:alpha-D-ribose 1-methylphosphonate 5-triphosphate synthase subunit PhnL
MFNQFAVLYQPELKVQKVKHSRAHFLAQFLLARDNISRCIWLLTPSPCLLVTPEGVKF